MVFSEGYDFSNNKLKYITNQDFSDIQLISDFPTNNFHFFVIA